MPILPGQKCLMLVRGDQRGNMGENTSSLTEGESSAGSDRFGSVLIKARRRERRLTAFSNVFDSIVVSQAGLEKVDVKGGIFLVDAGVGRVPEPVGHR
jgi:hypothetical protein